MTKVWTVVMVLVAVFVAVTIVLKAYMEQPVNIFTAIAAAGYIGGYCIARIADAWGFQLWETRGGDREVQP